MVMDTVKKSNISGKKLSIENLISMSLKLISFIALISTMCFCSESIENQEDENKFPGSENLSNIEPDIITEKVKYDSEDPAIWINKRDPSKSIVFGTDKNTDGAVYAYNLEGEIIDGMTVPDLKRPNNIDIAYDVKIGNQLKADILVVTERERKQLRIFEVPSMLPIDNGGLKIFEGESNEYRQPMGVALYTSSVDGAVYVIVSRKTGPENDYLFQYKIIPQMGKVSLELVRKFGDFSGEQEIEAIAVDNELGFIYYADENYCIRKYYAEPEMGNEELACFGQGVFEHDIEGIALVKEESGTGFIIVSNQQNKSFSVFSRKENDYIKELELGTKDTDGCDAVNLPLNETFNKGIFVAMNNSKNYYFYNLGKLSL